MPSTCRRPNSRERRYSKRQPLHCAPITNGRGTITPEDLPLKSRIGQRSTCEPARPRSRFPNPGPRRKKKNTTARIHKTSLACARPSPLPEPDSCIPQSSTHAPKGSCQSQQASSPSPRPHRSAHTLPSQHESARSALRPQPGICAVGTAAGADRGART